MLVPATSGEAVQGPEEPGADVHQVHLRRGEEGSGRLPVEHHEEVQREHG